MKRALPYALVVLAAALGVACDSNGDGQPDNPFQPSPPKPAEAAPSVAQPTQESGTRKALTGNVVVDRARGTSVCTVTNTGGEKMEMHLANWLSGPNGIKDVAGQELGNHTSFVVRPGETAKSGAVKFPVGCGVQPDCGTGSEPPTNATLYGQTSTLVAYEQIEGEACVAVPPSNPKPNPPPPPPPLTCGDLEPEMNVSAPEPIETDREGGKVRVIFGPEWAQVPNGPTGKASVCVDNDLVRGNGCFYGTRDLGNGEKTNWDFDRSFDGAYNVYFHFTLETPEGCGAQGTARIPEAEDDDEPDCDDDNPSSYEFKGGEKRIVGEGVDVWAEVAVTNGNWRVELRARNPQSGEEWLKNSKEACPSCEDGAKLLRVTYPCASCHKDSTFWVRVINKGTGAVVNLPPLPEI
jgi:hypothetical protein